MRCSRPVYPLFPHRGVENVSLLRVFYGSSCLAALTQVSWPTERWCAGHRRSRSSREEGRDCPTDATAEAALPGQTPLSLSLSLAGAYPTRVPPWAVHLWVLNKTLSSCSLFSALVLSSNPHPPAFAASASRGPCPVFPAHSSARQTSLLIPTAAGTQG